MIRRSNLRRLGKTARELSQLGIGGYSYWAAMLAENSSKPFGEKVARKLEDLLGLYRGQLDGRGLLEQPDMRKPQVDPPALGPGQATPTAMELAHLYDLIPPSDQLRRSKAYAAAVAAILAVLEGPPPSEPSSPGS